MNQRALASLRALLTAAAIALPAAGVGAQEPAPYITFDTAAQAAMTPDDAVAALVEGNRRYVGGESFRRDLRGQALITSKGQHPFAAVLSCLDSRGAPEIVFDQGIGDIFVGRVAGNVVDELMLGSLEFATAVAGAKLIVVMGHTECGAVKAACDGVEMGHITAIVDEIVPAVDALSTAPGTDRSSKNAGFVLDVTRQNVRTQVNEIVRRSPIIRELVDDGRIRIVAAVHDLATGEVTFF